ncbi:MAG: D-glycero-beta-D-manno-heptose-7-phosphate kinase [Cytophagales bacterium]|nr:MAG: D-glycero-beta-D-manno-heptose-7-phosphate kinase [Cytophagales bacterium]
MFSITTLFENFNTQKVLIIGDVMIDSYLWGKVDRISPEAPVPILNVQKREKRLGGAANVALNIKALGAQPILCSVLGDDSDADDVLRLMAESDLSIQGIIKSKNRITSIKHRIMSGAHHLVRVDQEDTHLLNSEEENNILEKIRGIISTVQVVVFEDYDKGILTESLIGKVIELARQYGIPTVVDPKKRNFLSYRGVSLFKPNKKELKEGIKTESSLQTIQEIDTAIEQLQHIIQASSVMITLSEQGIYYKSTNTAFQIPAHIRNISDVSGAGDTVISVAALCLSLGVEPKVMVELANLSGGLVCEKVGVVPINKEELLQEALKINLKN